MVFRSKQACDLNGDQRLHGICGRPMGLSFDEQTGQLFIADADNGLMVVGPRGGPATLLVSSVAGLRFNFLAAVDVCQATGIVYFTEASSNFKLRYLLINNVNLDFFF